MLFYAYNTYSARIAGTVGRSVVCEKCGCKFGYYVFRQASGSGHSPYMLDNQGASNRASGEAKGRLQRMLSTHTEPVPCPDCGWFQEAMINETRQRPGMWRNWYAPWLPTVNTQWPVAPLAAPGAPSPFRLEKGRYDFATAARADLQLPRFIDPGGGMQLQLREISFPKLCCGCLKDADQFHIISAGGGRLSVPLCSECKLANKGQSVSRHLILLLAIPVGVAFIVGLLSGLIFYLSRLSGVTTLEGAQIVALAFFLGFLCGGIALVVGAILGFKGVPAPVIVGGVDYMTGVTRIAFRNPGYIHLLQAHLAQQPLTAPA